MPPVVRKLPTPATSPIAELPPEGERLITMPAPPPNLAPALPTSSPAVIKPLSPERYKVQFTVSRETHEKLRRVQDLIRHSIRDGDVAAIVDRGLTLLLDDLARTKFAATDRGRAGRKASRGSRYIPAAIKREVWNRDGGRCAFRGDHGRCGETGFLEFHHVVPYADGGETAASNLELRCRTHNQHEVDLWSGLARRARALGA